MYKKLVEGSFNPREEGGVRAQFVNLPLCVALVATYVASGGRDLVSSGSRDLTAKLLLDICQREVERKQLATKPKTQIAALQEVAAYDQEHVNPEFEFDLLAAAGFESADMKKLVDHPLLDCVKGNVYRLSYEFLGPYLRALFLLSSFERQTAELDPGALTLMRQEAKGRGYMIEHIANLVGPEGLSILGRVHDIVKPEDLDARSFLFQAVQALVSGDSAIKTAHDRRIQVFSTLCQSFPDNFLVRNICITGLVDSLDLRGITFENSTFRDVTLRKCSADASTTFRRCKFSGELSFEGTDSDIAKWGSVELDQCSSFFPASAAWSDIKGSDILPWTDQVTDALRVALAKFWYHGRPKRSIKKADWNKGILRHLNLSNPLLDAMLRFRLLEEGEISGVPEGALVFNKDSFNDLQHFMDNQQVSGKIKQVYDELLSHKSA